MIYYLLYTIIIDDIRWTKKKNMIIYILLLKDLIFQIFLLILHHKTK